MNATTIALSLGAIALLFVVAPFLRGKARGDGDASGVTRRRGAGPVESALPDALEELELDRAMGKVTDADYERARQGIERERAAVAGRAAAAAQSAASAEIDGADAGASTGEEQDVRDVAAMAEAMIRAARREVVSCSQCGARPEPAARFCSSCGRAIAA